MGKKKDVDVRTDDERDYEPGLGCIGVGCKAAFYTTADRAAHIKTEHPGEYQGPTADLQFVMDRIKDIHHDRRDDGE